MLVGSVVVFAGSLVLRSGGAYSPFWDGWVGNVPLRVPALACFARAFVGGPRRAAAVWLGLGILSFTVANVIYLGVDAVSGHPPVPSASDIGYLGIYPFVGAAVVSLVRLADGSLAKSLWLDASLGAAGGATLLAAVLSPVLSGVEGNLAEVLVGAAYPVAELLLVAMICGLLAVRGAGGGSLWLWLVGGLLIFCAADVVYALRVVNDTYVVGTVLDALWAVGLTVMAFAIWRPERPRAISSGRSAAILAVPMLATLTAVVVLIVSSFNWLSVTAIALATFTLLLAAARTFVAFSQVQRLSDARRQAMTDDLTGLGNRRALFEHGERLLKGADRSERLALILIDLDNFKEINDTLGHPAGDELLRETARRLVARLGHDDLLARLGGDEFALLVTLAAGEDEREIARQILDRLTCPLVIQGVPVRVAASAGVAVREDTAGIAELLRRSDVAMYAAKHDQSRVRLYDQALAKANRTRLGLVQGLEAALAQREFVLHYQPKLDIHSGATVGAEALVRWQHPTRGLLYPDAFLPVIEQSGLMSSLAGLVLEAAIEQLATWHQAGLDITIAVNLSASDLLDVHLAERIAGCSPSTPCRSARSRSSSPRAS